MFRKKDINQIHRQNTFKKGRQRCQNSVKSHLSKPCKQCVKGPLAQLRDEIGDLAYVSVAF